MSEASKTSKRPIVKFADAYLASPTKVRSDLRQAVWEASQFMSLDEIDEYVDAVLREIESDEP